MERNWKEYNLRLVKRGEFYLNFEFLYTWNKEINEANKGKIGQPYLYPESLIRFLGVLHCKNFDYRALDGIIRKLSENYQFHFPSISYSQICRRLNKLNFNFECNEENLIVAIDGSGEKMGNRGDYMNYKWKVKKPWIKVVLMGTTDGKIVDIEVGLDKLDERRVARELIKKHKNKIKKVIMDGLHDCKETFNLCEEYEIDSVIKVRKNARTRSRGSPRRRKEVVEYKLLGHKEWVKKRGYGYRWPASEGIFSADKRIFGENIRARVKENMFNEVRLKFWAYNQLLNV